MNNIVLICDDAYAMPTMVCIQSIINHAEVRGKLCVHVCSFGLSEKNVRAFEKMGTARTNVCVHLFPRNSIEEKIERVSQKTHVTTTALIKLELPNYFSNLDKVLYLDSDTIVKGNINDLFCADITDYYLAASFEYWAHLINLRYKIHKDHNEKFYFNSGVMLLNLRKMREDNISEKLWEYKLNSTQTKLMDQECLNAVCGSAVMPLSIKWNFNPEFLVEENVEEINKVYTEAYLNCQHLFDDVRIIHFVGKMDKPWVYESAKLREYWHKEYECLYGSTVLPLKPAETARKNIFASSLDKIKAHGVIGFICFLCYRLQRCSARKFLVQGCGEKRG